GGRGRSGNHKITVSCHKVLKRRRATAIRHKSKSGSGRFLEVQTAEMTAASERPTQGSHRAVRISLEPCDQLFEILCRNCVLADQHHRLAWKQGHSFEIREHIVLNWKDGRARDVTRLVAEAKRVAVRRSSPDPPN